MLPFAAVPLCCADGCATAAFCCASSPQTSSAMFFKYNTSLGPPFHIIVDTNFINFAIKNKLDVVRSMMDCLLAKCTLLSSASSLHQHTHNAICLSGCAQAVAGWRRAPSSLDPPAPFSRALRLVVCTVVRAISGSLAMRNRHSMHHGLCDGGVGEAGAEVPHRAAFS